MMKLYYASGDCSFAIHAFLNECGADYQAQKVELSAGDNKKPEFLQLNSRGQVPVLTDGDTVLREGAAILMYVADKYKSPMIPQAGAERLAAIVRMQVDRLDPGYTKVKAIVAKYDAYFGSDNRSQRDNEITQNMNIRVPAVKFDSILEELVDEGIYINYKNVSAEDVTDQFIDVEARLKTKKEVELRYLALLKEAKKVSEILEVENNFSTIRDEIESFEGRMKLLNDQIAYSDINLAMYQTLEYMAKPKVSFGSQVVESLANGWTSLVVFTLHVIAAWPFLIPLLLLFIAIKKWRSGKK